MIPASRHLVTTAPRRSTCTPCRRVILDGLDTGWPYSVDAIPLNLEGELDARLRGLRTYRVIGERLAIREPLDIAADTTKGRPPVCAAHSCTPVNPAHIDPAHVGVFMKLTAEAPQATVEQVDDQQSLFVISGRFAGARITAVPAEDLECPF